MAAGSVAGAGAIGWLAHYFSRPPPDADPGNAIAFMGDVSTVYRRAFALGKPMLVLVIPVKDDEKSARGEVFGALLNHGGPAVYLDLALSEIVCATVATVEAQLRDVEVKGEPLMLLVETDRAGGRVTPIDPKLRYDVVDDKFLQDRMETVAGAFHDALLPDAGSLAARAKLVEARLPAEQLTAVLAAISAGTSLDARALDDAAALVRAIAEDLAAPRAHALDALAEAAEGRVQARPVGAKWANIGCGVEIEGEPTIGIDCGMAMVPELSRRFLWFFTQ